MRSPRSWTDVNGPPQHITDTIFIADALRARFDRVDMMRVSDRH